MAMLGINPSSQYQGRSGTLDRIAKGVQIAAQILGTGTQVYKTFAADIPQAKAQVNYLNEESNFKKQTIQMQLAQMGFMPVDTDHIHVPDVSTGSGAVNIEHGGVKVQTNQSSPNVMKVGDQTYLQVANPMTLNENQKLRLDGELEHGNWVLTGETDKDQNKVPFFLPNAPFAYYKKPAELPAEKKVQLGMESNKSFEGLDDVARFNQVNQSAQLAFNYKQDIMHGQAPDPSRDTALAQSFVNSLAKTARVQAGNIEDMQALVEHTVPGMWQKIKGAITGGQAKIDANDRNQMIGAIGTVYQSVRPLYDQAYQTYASQAQQSGLQIAPPKAPIDFSSIGFGGGLNSRVSSPARTLGMQGEQQNANNPQFQTNFPAPTPLAPHQVNKTLGILRGQ